MNVTFIPQSVSVAADPASYGINVGNPIARDYVGCDPYEGSYTITPSNERQTLSVQNMRMTEDLTIEPIPSNYGLVTWNGSVITIT